MLRSLSSRCHRVGAASPFRTTPHADPPTRLATRQRFDPLDQDPFRAHPIRGDHVQDPRRFQSCRSREARASCVIRARRVNVAARFSHPFARSPSPIRVNGSTTCTGLDHSSPSLAARQRAIEMRSTNLCHTHPVKDRVIPERPKPAGARDEIPQHPFALRPVTRRALRRAAHASINAEASMCRLATTETHAR